MLKIVLVATFSLLITSPVAAQVYSSMIPDTTIVSFLNWKFANEPRHAEEPRLKRKQLSSTILKWTSTNFILEQKDSNLEFKESLFPLLQKGIDTLFSQEDRNHLLVQLNSQLNTSWRHSFTKTRAIKKVKAKNANKYHISLPLFSLDKRYLIIHEFYYCGDECSHRSYKVYKKTAYSWEYIGSLLEQMS
jgi:hypothetical protein